MSPARTRKRASRTLNAPALRRHRVALAHQTMRADASKETHVFVGQVLVPREYEERIHSTDVIALPDGRATMIYLCVGWNVGGDTDTHMITLGGSVNAPHPAEITKALANTRRCYCDQCLDRDSHSVKDRKIGQLIEVLTVRKAIADANKIPTDGHPDNEAKINRLLEAATE